MTLLPAILILAGCPPALEPTAPFTSRAVETGWGEPVNGVSILGATDADTVDVGAKLEFEVFFRFWPLDSDGRVHVLNPDRGEEDCALHLVSSDGSRSYRRPQFTPGSPVFRPPDDPVDLLDDPSPSRSDTFLLLAEDGEQVAPGDYRAHVEYTNTGNNTVVTWFGYGERDSFPPAELWGGTVRTASMSLHVAAKDADTTWCELPTRMEIFEQPFPPPGWHRGEVAAADSGSQLMLRWADDSFEPVEVVSRPGFHVGFATQGRKFLNDELITSPDGDDQDAVSEFHRIYGFEGWGSLGGLPQSRLVGGGATLTGPAFREVFSEEDVLRVEVDATVFETSAPSESRWRPERGDYRVLIHRKIVKTWPEDR